MLPGVNQKVLGARDAAELGHERSDFHEVGSCSNDADEFHAALEFNDFRRSGLPRKRMGPKEC